VGGGVFDLGFLELCDPLLVDEDGEVVSVLVVLLGVQEEHTVSFAGRLDQHLHSALLVDLLRRCFGGQGLLIFCCCKRWH
jgi:hypothetical protein